MMWERILIVAMLSTSAGVAPRGNDRAQSALGQAVAASTDRPLATLPAALRDRGRRILAEADEDRRADLVEELADADVLGALDFLLALLETDPSPDVRENIVDELEGVMDPRVNPALEKRVLGDPDLEIALASLDLLRARAETPLLRLLERRLETERTRGGAEAVGRLVREQERWTTIVRGGLLPTFLQVPPPVFAAVPPQPSVRVLAFGDFGDGSDAQRQVAAAMLRYHQNRPFDLGVTLGDNFYSRGMDSLTDPRWETQWSALYDPLKIRFYPTLGNHDWNQPNSPAAEILFTRDSPSWRMPASYYTYTAGPIQFFALDTDIISAAQLLWLDRELGRSTAPWKIVYGHHPIYSAGRHEDNDEKILQLLPVLRDRVDVYLAGHDHDMQHLKPEGRLHFFVAGSGGKVRTIEPGPRSLFAKGANGLAVIDADARSLTVTFVEKDLTSPYTYTLTH